MSVLGSLFRRQMLESRWSLGLSALALSAAGYMTTWLAKNFEIIIAKGATGNNIRRVGVLRGLGGPAMDYSTTALEILWWNHPLIVLPVLAWAITRASAAVAGEIDRGTIDVTLSRPVSRSTYLASQVAFAVFGLLVMVSAIALGCCVGNQVYTLKTPFPATILLRPAASLLALGLAAFGYTLPFSAFDVVKWRAALAGAVITLASLVALTVEPWYEGYFFHDWLERISVFQFYAPVTSALKGDPLGLNLTVLSGVFAAGLLISFYWFARRDLPANS